MSSPSHSSPPPGAWTCLPLGKLVVKQKQKNSDFRYSLVFSNSARHGIIPQREQFDKEIANQERVDGYYIVHNNFFAYNPRISVSAPCGPISMNETGHSGVMSPLYTVFSLESNLVERSFLKYYFQSTLWHRHMKSVANYGARHDRMNISDEDFFSMPIYLPDKDEQNKIVSILQIQDRLIELKEKLLTEKQRQKQALMQQLLTGRRRLPGFSGTWQKTRLKSITKRISRKNNIGNNNVLTISAQHGLINQSEFFNKEVASADKSNYYLLNRDDFAYNKSYSNGYPYGTIKRLSRYSSGIVSPLYICFRLCSNQVSIDYLEHYFEAGCLNREIQAFAQEGARNHGLLNIAVSDFFNSNLLLPPKEEQGAIAAIISTAEREIRLLRQSIEQERQKKKALMQLLLTGAVRV